MSLLKKLGYNRKEEVLEFNNKRSCGLWLLLIGLVLAISLACGGDFYINPFVFMAGYYICFYIANINKKVRQHFSNGKFSKFQIKIVYISIALLFILMFLIAGPFFAGGRWKFLWLGVLLATGLHFFILYPQFVFFDAEAHRAVGEKADALIILKDGIHAMDATLENNK